MPDTAPLAADAYPEVHAAGTPLTGLGTLAVGVMALALLLSFALGPPVLCVAGRGSLDEAAAAMLAQLLEKHGIGARVVPSEEVSVATVLRLDVTGVQMACLSYLEPGSFTSPRYLVRRLRRRLPQAKIVAGLWTLTANEVEARDALVATRADRVVTSLRQAVEQVVNAEREAASPRS